MELEEMKNAWLQIDERLKKQEILRTNMLRDMLHTKMTMALGKLRNVEVLGLVVNLLALPLLFFCIFLMRKSTDPILIIVLPFYYVMTFGACGFTVSSIWKTRLLSRINSSESLKNNLNCIHSYDSFIQKEKKFLLVYTLIGSVILLIFFIEYFSFEKNGFWAFLILLPIPAFIWIFIWQYKFYKSNIDSVVRNLSELKELEADTDELPPVPPTNIDI